MTESEFMRAAEIAKLLGFTERTIRRRFKDGTIPSVKIGGARLASKTAVRRLLRRADPTPDVDENE